MINKLYPAAELFDDFVIHTFKESSLLGAPDLVSLCWDATNLMPYMLCHQLGWRINYTISGYIQNTEEWPYHIAPIPLPSPCHDASEGFDYEPIFSEIDKRIYFARTPTELNPTAFTVPSKINKDNIFACFDDFTMKKINQFHELGLDMRIQYTGDDLVDMKSDGVLRVLSNYDYSPVTSD
jgi:hypothetical protein